MKRLPAVASGAGGLLVVAGLIVVLSAGSGPSVTAPGTTVAGIPAAGLDARQLQQLVLDTVATQPEVVVVEVGTRTVKLRPRELGLTVDVLATAQRALRTSGAHRRFGIFPATGKNVDAVLSVDQADVNTTTKRLLSEADVPESHGLLHYADGDLTSTGPSAGQFTTRGAVNKALRSAFTRLTLPGRVSVPVAKREAHVTQAAVDALAAQAQSLLRATATLQAGGRTEPLAGRDLAPHLIIAGTGDTPGHALTLGLDELAGTRLAQPLAARLSVATREPTIAAPAATRVLTTQGSTLWRPRAAAVRLATPGKAGQKVRVDDVLSAILTQLRRDSPISVIPVASFTAQPDISDAGARSVNALLGTFTTPFKCCQPRVTNIALMARTLDGTLIAPGQAFSLNGIIGRRTKAKGYVEAPFIVDGELSTDVGGGVSQVATTTLNAAFFAGVQLDKHQAHSFYISRYPPGREATVNYPSIDLAWTNTTGAPILVRAATSPTSLTVSLYGRDDGRTVQAISGTRTPVAGRDFRIRIDRILRVPGQRAMQDGFTTTYNKPPQGE